MTFEDELEHAGNVHLELGPASAFALIGLLQLALRHPDNRGPASEIARKLVDDLKAHFETAGCKGVAKLIDMGDDPRYDQPIRRAE